MIAMIAIDSSDHIIIDH